MLFLAKSSSARRSLLALLLALCCLSSALGAKITKTADKPQADGNNKEDKAETAAEAAAQAAESNKPDEDEDEDAKPIADADGDEDEDKDDEEEEQSAEKEEVAVAATTPTGNKNELKPTTDLTDVWGIVRSLWTWLRSDLRESLFGDDDDEKPDKVEGRTFGKIRRLQMALVPIIFKFGVLSAMVAFLVAIGMKSLFLLKVLVVMNALAILGKFLTLKSSLFGSYENTAPSFSYPGWNPHAKEASWSPTYLSNSGPPPHPPNKEIHLHIHGNAPAHAQLAAPSYNYETQNGWASRSDPYVAYNQPLGQYQEQLTSELPNITNPMSLLPTKYPARSFVR